MLYYYFVFILLPLGYVHSTQKTPNQTELDLNSSSIGSSTSSTSPILHSIPILVVLSLVCFTVGMCIFVFICCRYVLSRRVQSTKLNDKLDLKDDFIFGPDLCELILYRTDQWDYNHETSRVISSDTNIKLPQVRFTVHYDNETETLKFSLHEFKDIREGRKANLQVYAKVNFKPINKKTYRTQVLKYSTNPVFDAEFILKDIVYEKLKSCTITITLRDHHLTIPRTVCEIKIPINELSLEKKGLTKWRLILPDFKAGLFTRHSNGYICIGLSYFPNESVLSVGVLKCQKLKFPKTGTAATSNSSSAVYVLVFLIQNSKKIKKRKSKVVYGNTNPVFNDSFSFKLPLKLIEETSVLFEVSNYMKDELRVPFAQCIVGQLGSGGQREKQWTQMRRSKDALVCEWQPLMPI